MTEKRYRISDEAYYVYSDIYDGDELLRNDEVVKFLNEQEKEIRQLNHLVRIATSIIEWNTVPQIRRAWQNYLNKVDDVK